jgi:biopolymer transport protein ExbD
MKPKVLVSGLAFVIVVVGLGFFLRPEPARQPVICSVHILLHADGLVSFDGVQFSDDQNLRTRLVSYKKENPDCFLSTISDEGVQSQSIEHVARIMQQAGFSSVGFITEPHALSH